MTAELKRRPYCCDCAWYEASGMRAQTCENPAVLGMTQLVVGPYPDVLGVDATVARFTEAMCGLDGRLYMAGAQLRSEQIALRQRDVERVLNTRMPSEPAETAGRQND